MILNQKINYNKLDTVKELIKGFNLVKVHFKNYKLQIVKQVRIRIQNTIQSRLNCKLDSILL